MLSRFHPIPESHGQRERDGQTDGQTDRIAISISCVSVLTRDKNRCKCESLVKNFKKQIDNHFTISRHHVEGNYVKTSCTYTYSNAMNMIPEGCLVVLSFDMFDLSPFTAGSRDVDFEVLVVLVTAAVAGLCTSLC